MEFPDGYSHHHQCRRDDELEEEYPPPPPPSRHLTSPYYKAKESPQPIHVTHTYHGGPGGGSYSYPYPPPITDYYAPPPPYRPPTNDFPYSLDPPAYPPPPTNPYSSVVHHHIYHHSPELPIQKPTVRVFTKAETNYSLSIRDGQVVLAPSDPSDPFQHWIKDGKFSTKVKDEQGFPSFALINKATGQAMKHSIGETHPVQLIPYNRDGHHVDESILWTLSVDLGDGYRTIRMVNNIRLNVDAFHGDKNHGGVHDGTTIVLWRWLKGDNQRWKILPY